MLIATSRLFIRCRSISASRGLSKLVQQRAMIVVPNQFQLKALSNSRHPSFGLIADCSINAVAANRWHQRWISSTSGHSHSKQFISFHGCRNVGDVLKLAMKHIANLPPSPTAATWNSISRLISKDQRFHHNRLELEQQIQALLHHTTDSLAKCKPKELATITLSIAKIVRSVREAHARRRVNFYHQSIGKVLQESSSNPNQGIFHALAKATDANLPHFESQALANIAYAYALLGYDPKINERSLLGGIAEKSIDCIHQFKAQEFANTVWSYAKLIVYHPQLFQSVGDSVASKLDLNEFTPQNLANIVWAYSTTKIQHPNLFLKIGDAVASKRDLNEFNPQDLANTVWAYAKTETQHAGLFQSVGNAVASKCDLDEFKPQQLANIVWAYATTNAQHAGLFQNVGDSIAAMDDLSSFKPQALANIVWAYATNNSHHPNLFQKVGNSIVATDDLRSFGPQALANIVWAYAKTETQHSGLFQSVGDSIVNVAMDDLRSFNPQNLANIVWAYAKINIQHPGLFKKVGDSIVAMDDLSSFKPQNLGNIAWAYATSNTRHPNLFQKVGDAIVSSDGSKPFTTQDLSIIVWAYAKLDVKHPGLFKKIGKSIGALDDLSSFNTQALANIAWSFAMADVDVPVAFNDAFTRALFEKQNEFNVKELPQLHRWHVWQAEEKSSTGLPEVLRDRCERAYIKSHTSSARVHNSSSIPHECKNELKKIIYLNAKK
eukprot:scaffold17701_cov38-Cyclotella_meneghiniana.AAC.2